MKLTRKTDIGETMKTYHVFIDTDAHGNHVPVILDREPAHHQSALICGNDEGDTYLIYGDVNLHTGLAIDIGRAIERRNLASSAT